MRIYLSSFPKIGMWVFGFNFEIENTKEGNQLLLINFF
jgi:hypothetical protein